MFLWWSSTKIVQAIRIRQKTWPPGGGAYFPYVSIIKTLKIFLSETTGPISIYFCKNVPLVILYQDCSSHSDSSKKHGRQGAGLIFPMYLYRKLEKSSCQKPLDQFPYTFAEMFLWWSSTKIVQAIWIRQKTWPLGGGAYFPCISI